MPKTGPCGQESAIALPPYLLSDPKYCTVKTFQDGCLMAECAMIIQDREEDLFAGLPLSQTVELDMLGGNVRYALDQWGPRAAEPVYEDLTTIPLEAAPDWNQGLSAQVKEALKLVKQNGRNTLLNLSGPLTVLTGLVPIEMFFYARRKAPESYRKVLLWTAQRLLDYLQALGPEDIALVSLADPIGSLELLGEGPMKELAEYCYKPLLKGALDMGLALHICPKMTDVLLRFTSVKEVYLPAADAVSYSKACLDLAEKPVIIAHQCIKRKGMADFTKGIRTLVFED